MAAVSNGADTIFFAEMGTGATTVYAHWNGSGYDDVHVVIWAYDPGDESETSIDGYQVAMYDAIPTVGATGDVTWVPTDSYWGNIDVNRTDWLHYAAGMGFQFVAGTPPSYLMAASLLMGADGIPLDDTPRYLAETTFEISPDATGTWVVRPYCPAGDQCATGPNCVQSAIPCTGDTDCPRFSILGDASDTCDLDGIDADDGLILIDHDEGAVPYLVETLEIVIPIGRCCVDLECHDLHSVEDCDALGGVYDDTRTCAHGCGCGDGLVGFDEGETCDDGNEDNTDACLNSCDEATCGDGFVWAGVEECDDANSVDTDACVAGCVSASCGDGFVWMGYEACDDGNLLDGDGCDSNCTPTGCGNGIATSGEACDTGGASATCDGDCTLPVCGDGVLNQFASEQCDDANTVDGDGCSSTCTYEMVACSTDVDCVLAHNNVCDWDDCDEGAGVCLPAIPNMFGDVCGTDFGVSPNGAVNLTDVLCTLNAFGAGNMINCPNADVAVVGAGDCPGGNGVVNLTDILKVLDAFGAPTAPTAVFFCDCPSNP